ncbi:MAG: hypothetical protein NDJ72_04775 [Elusimicrobia bacterium]|nr:hypothetical protein [Elusimicrobiota bacterium]
MKTDNDAERIVLLNAREDYGLLWQILDEVRAAMPGAAPEAALRAAREAVFSLMAKGLLDVYRRSSRKVPFERLDAADGEAALNADEYWRGDDTDPVEIAVAATPKGGEAHETPA